VFVSKNLARFRYLKINHQNNEERSNLDDNAAKSFNILVNVLNVLQLFWQSKQNYFQICSW